MDGSKEGSPHLTGVLGGAGSKPTMSNRSRSRGVNTSGSSFTTCALGQAGPPQLNSTEPTRRSLSRAGNLVKASDTSGPFGRDQSSGTRSVEHCTAGASSHASHFKDSRCFAFADEPFAWAGGPARTSASAMPKISTRPAFLRRTIPRS